MLKRMIQHQKSLMCHSESVTSNRWSEKASQRRQCLSRDVKEVRKLVLWLAGIRA